MLGLPGETMEDVLGIADIAAKLRGIYYEVPREKRGGGFKLTVSVACFVPKPHTPFSGRRRTAGIPGGKAAAAERGAAPGEGREVQLARCQAQHAGGGVCARRQAACRCSARGVPQRLPFLTAGWSCFDFEKWRAAFEQTGVDPAFYAARERGFEETLPWDVIDTGVSKAYLWSEKRRGDEGAATPDCRQGARAAA